VVLLEYMSVLARFSWSVLALMFAAVEARRLGVHYVRVVSVFTAYILYRIRVLYKVC
jgi:hypothetical protein